MGKRTTAIVPKPENIRISHQFPIELHVRFKVVTRSVVQKVGNGRTILISSRSLLFRTDEELRVGNVLHLDLSWPAQLSSNVALKLEVHGCVTQVGLGMAMVTIERYEFRTQAM